jgi:Flp pilus assembly protein TadB
MDNFSNIKSLWQSQPAANMPSPELIKKMAEKSRTRLILRYVLILLALGATLIFIIVTGCLADFKYAVTKAGLLLIIISIIGALVLNGGLLKLLLKKADETLDSHAYLQQLIQYRNRQKFMHMRGLVIYFTTLSAGFTLYFYEFLMMNRTMGIIAYAATAAWIAFVWFFLRKRMIKKQEMKINTLITQIESISKQLGEE